MRESLPQGWVHTNIASVTREESNRVGSREGVRVLSSTKHHGLVPSDEYFKNRTIYSSDTSGYKLVRQGEFAYATNHLAEGSIGFQDKFNEACVSPIYTVFSANERVYGPYFFRLLKSDYILAYYKLHEQASVDRRGAIRYPDFSGIPIILPPVSEQRKISEVLASVDSGVLACSSGISKMEALRGSVSAKLIGQSSGVHDLLGSYISGIQSGKSPDVPGRPAGSSQWGVLKVSAVQADGFTSSENKVIENPNHVFEELEVNHGDLLMTRANTPALVGMSCLVVNPRPRLMLSDKILRLGVREDKANKKFIRYLLQSEEARRQIELLGTGSSGSMKNISRSEIKSLEFSWPELEEQQNIVSIIEAHDERIAAERARLEKLRKLKAGLMDDLLTGRVRVDQLQDLPV